MDTHTRAPLISTLFAVVAAISQGAAAQSAAVIASGNGSVSIYNEQEKRGNERSQAASPHQPTRRARIGSNNADEKEN